MDKNDFVKSFLQKLNPFLYKSRQFVGRVVAGIKTKISPSIISKKTTRFGAETKKCLSSFSIVCASLLIVLCLFSFTPSDTATDDQIGEWLLMVSDMWPSETIPTEPVQSDQRPSGQPGGADFEVTETIPVETVQRVEYKTSQMCFIGDGRMEDVQEAVFTDATFITKNDAGFEWFKSEAIAAFEKKIDSIEMCVIALGLNDMERVDYYIDAFNNFANKYPDKVFVYVNVGPIDESKFSDTTNSAISGFNDKIKQGLSDRWQIVDQYAYLIEHGFKSDDGVNYLMKDSASIFAWIVETIKIQEIMIV